jgi:hypothetical protein
MDSTRGGPKSIVPLGRRSKYRHRAREEGASEIHFELEK